MSDKLRAELYELYLKLEDRYSKLARLEEDVKRLQYEIFRTEVDKCFVEHELRKELQNENQSNGN